MPDLTVSSAVDTLMQATTVAEMRTALDLDTNYVNLSGTQTISGAKTFSSAITMSSADIELEGNILYFGTSGGAGMSYDSFSGLTNLYSELAPQGLQMDGYSIYLDTGFSNYIMSNAGFGGDVEIYLPNLPTSNPFVTGQVYQDSSGHLRIS